MKKYINHWIISLLEMKLWFRNIFKIDNVSRESGNRIVSIAKGMLLDIEYKIIVNRQWNDFIIADKKTELNKYLKEYEKNNIKWMATLLWYPDCCIDNYYNISKITWDNPNIDIYFKDIFMKSKEKKTIFNTHISQWGIVIHYPCSLACKQTISRSRKIFKIFSKMMWIQDIKKYLVNFHTWD